MPASPPYYRVPNDTGTGTCTVPPAREDLNSYLSALTTYSYLYLICTYTHHVPRNESSTYRTC
eukprot:scaffold443649_cov15-Prasinocladus_malaysianus.AAC.1